MVSIKFEIEMFLEFLMLVSVILLFVGWIGEGIKKSLAEIYEYCMELIVIRVYQKIFNGIKEDLLIFYLKHKEFLLLYFIIAIYIAYNSYLLSEEFFCVNKFDDIIEHRRDRIFEVHPVNDECLRLYRLKNSIETIEFLKLEISKKNTSHLTPEFTFDTSYYEELTLTYENLVEFANEHPTYECGKGEPERTMLLLNGCDDILEIVLSAGSTKAMFQNLLTYITLNKDSVYDYDITRLNTPPTQTEIQFAKRTEFSDGFTRFTWPDLIILNRIVTDIAWILTYYYLNVSEGLTLSSGDTCMIKTKDLEDYYVLYMNITGNNLTNPVEFIISFVGYDSIPVTAKNLSLLAILISPHIFPRDIYIYDAMSISTSLDDMNEDLPEGEIHKRFEEISTQMHEKCMRRDLNREQARNIDIFEAAFLDFLDNTLLYYFLLRMDVIFEFY